MGATFKNRLEENQKNLYSKEAEKKRDTPSFLNQGLSLHVLKIYTPTNAQSARAVSFS